MTGTDGHDAQPGAAPGAEGQRQGARALEEHFLGEAGDLTREQVERRAGIDAQTTRRLWRALGFVDAEPGEPAFTEADAQALAATEGLVEQHGIPLPTAEALARALGQAMSHLAEAQVEVVSDVLARDPELVRLAREDPAGLVDRVLVLVQPLEQPMQELVLYAWRRHLVAAAQRQLAGAGTPAGEPVVVGFADVVGYTTYTRDMGAGDLAELVEQFEAVAFDAVVRHGGRVVKTLGDEVMFVVDDPVAGAETGLALAEAFAAGLTTPGGVRLPEVRVGLALGPALARGGDLFGAVVNLASRCTSIARPSSVLVDRELAAALRQRDGDEAGERFALRRLRAVRVRGYEHLEASVLRRTRRGSPA